MGPASLPQCDLGGAAHPAEELDQLRISDRFGYPFRSDPDARFGSDPDTGFGAIRTPVSVPVGRGAGALRG